MRRGGWLAALAAMALLTGCAGGGSPAPTKTVCYCFLNEHPCESSRRLEEWTRDALKAEFSAEFQSGRLSFQSVNYDRPENAHVLKDYALPFQSIVLQDAGNPKRWKRLDRLWELLGDEKAFRQYAQDETKAFLEGR